MTDKVIGTIQGLQTLSDGSVRLKIDIPHENVPTNIIKWCYQEVSVKCRENIENGE